MSPKNHIHPLHYMCVKTLSSILMHTLCDDEETSREIIVENYLTETTYEVVQELLKNILNSVNVDAATRFACLRVLLRRDVRKLDTGIFPHSYYESILKVIAEKGLGLQQLNLKGVWVKEYPGLLSQLIKKLKRLKVLVIPHMADDEVLETLNECTLQALDISGECSFTIQGLKNVHSQTITILEIGNFGKRDVCLHEKTDCDIIAEIIGNLPNLTSLRTYSFTGKSLLTIYKRNINFKTRLKYLHDTGTTREIMEAILNTSVNLESIHLDTPEANLIPELSYLKKLVCLKLVHHENGDLLEYLRRSGDKLQVLKLNHNKRSNLDLCDVCTYVPNLQTLECFQLKLTYSNINSYFMCLENIEILYCDISDSSLRNIFANSPFLKRVIVGCIVNFTDGDIFRLCAECEFLYLEELWFSNARNLTAISVELFMGHCPNLKVLGQLSGWDLHQEEIDYLKTVIVYTNTDLTLLPIGS